MSQIFCTERLTWNQLRPWPFESSWSTFSKVMCINALTWRELQDLIAQAAITEPSKVNSPFLRSDWIDFEKYSTLLGVESRRLKEGFLDRFGIEPAEWSPSVVRHCPVCRDMGYHCVLFPLSIVSHCPWHDVPLNDAYSAASNLAVFGGQRTVGRLFPCEPEAFDYPYGQASEAKIPLTSMCLTIPDGLKKEIPSFCNRLVGWLRALRLSNPDAPELLRPLLKCGKSYDLSQADHMNLLFGYAETLAQPPMPWRLGVTGLPSVAVVWEEDVFRNDCCASEVENYFRLARKAVRRQISKRFLRPHRKCLRTLSAMNEGERLSLDSRSICSVCVAFVAWTRVHDACYASAVRRMITDASASSTGKQRTLVLSANAQYANFLRIWADLEELRNRTNVYVVEPLPDEITFDLPFISLRPRGGSRRADDHFSAKVVVPNSSVLAEISAKHCQQRLREHRAMTNRAAVETYYRWRWANVPGESLFKIKSYAARLHIYDTLVI